VMVIVILLLMLCKSCKSFVNINITNLVNFAHPLEYSYLLGNFFLDTPFPLNLRKVMETNKMKKKIKNHTS
jgi:hypothetical protein